MVRRHKRKETHLLARFHQVEMGRKALRAEGTACTAVRGQDEPEGERRVHHSKKFNVNGAQLWGGGDFGKAICGQGIKDMV